MQRGRGERILPSVYPDFRVHTGDYYDNYLKKSRENFCAADKKKENVNYRHQKKQKDQQDKTLIDATNMTLLKETGTRLMNMRQKIPLTPKVSGPRPNQNLTIAIDPIKPNYREGRQGNKRKKKSGPPNPDERRAFHAGLKFRGTDVSTPRSFDVALGHPNVAQRLHRTRDVKHEQETVILTSFNGTNKEIPSPIRKVDPNGNIDFYSVSGLWTLYLIPNSITLIDFHQKKM